MANKDYSSPATVVITNNAVPVQMTDGGTRYVPYSEAIVLEPAVATEYAAGNIDKVPVTSIVRTQETVDGEEVISDTIQSVDMVKYKTGDRVIQLYKTNTFVTLRSGETLTINTSSAGETAYFATLANDDISVVTTSLVGALIDIDDVTLDYNSITIQKNATQTLVATVSPSDTTRDTDVVWSSSNTAVATVNASTGLVTGIASGTCTITATTINGKTATCVVSVNVAVSTLTFSPASATKAAGETQAVTVATNAGATQQEVEFYSDDTDIATVVKTGALAATITAVATGTCNIIAVSDAGAAGATVTGTHAFTVS